MTLDFRSEDSVPDNHLPLAPIFHVPHARNRAFTGRDVTLDDLHEDLTSDPSPKHVQAFYGMGGVGKTQLAVEYAYRCAESDRSGDWSRAEERASTWLDYAALARRIGLRVPAYA